MTSSDEKHIFSKIRNDDRKAFRELFDTWYAPLCLYASRFLNNNEQAEETIQELFVKIWEKRKSVDVKTSVKNYLFRSVRNLCLNQIQHDKMKQLHAHNLKQALITEDPGEDDLITPEMILQLEEGIGSLPEKRREIFRLSREEGLKYREIAERLNISVKTVEAQMGLALKTLRSKIGAVLFFVIVKLIK